MNARRPAIAIVGGGFSGAMVAVQLARQASGPLDVHLFEPGEPGLGIAYATDDPEHLLNVPAARMGALAGEPGHFWEWLKTQPTAVSYNEGDFVPRLLYGAYLAELFAEACRTGAAKDVRIEHHRNEVRDVSRVEKGLRVTLDDTTIDADYGVLALGNLHAPGEASSFPGLPGGSPRLLPNAWEKEGVARLTEVAANAGVESNIFILGTGLTTVDTILTLLRLGYRGRFSLLSRNSKLPLQHAASTPYHWDDPPPSLPRLMQRLRAAVREGEWRGVVDGLRPHTVRLWLSLNYREKRRFFSRLFTLWNIHRHRMAPQIAARLDALAEESRLTLLKGRIVQTEETEDGLRIIYRINGEHHAVTADYAIACIGPGYDVRRNPHPLLARLLEQGSILPHALENGLEAEGYLLSGNLVPRLYGLGAVLIGERLETTAVPELREQASDVAAALRHLLAKR